MWSRGAARGRLCRAKASQTFTDGAKARWCCHSSIRDARGPSMTRRGRRLLTVAVLVAVSGAMMISAHVRWRAQVVLLYLTGQIADIGLKPLLVYMMPGSDQYLRPLAESHNPYAVIRNVKTTSADIQAGAQLFRSQCASCHAPDGSGGVGGPALIRRTFKHGESDWAVYRVVRFGVPNTAMRPHPLPETELWQVVAFLRSINSPDSTSGAVGHGAGRSLGVNVSYEIGRAHV